MITVRAPLRISFVGGGTDLPDFYRRSPGRVISTAIDKYVYLVINHTPLVEKISVRYAVSETVDSPHEIQHTRVRAALLDLGISSNVEIGSFAMVPARTGLGSSSSFSVALMKGLHAYLGKKLSPQEAAEAACRLEINLLGEPIGKQDQYAAAFGGFNIFQFNPDGSVNKEPVLLDYKQQQLFKQDLLLFFTGVMREASDVLEDQKRNIDKHFETYKSMADSVSDFHESLLAGDIKGIARLLHEGWLRKKSLSDKVASPLIDTLYETGINAGAWGGKILGAGGGGCLLFVAPPELHGTILQSLKAVTQREGLSGAQPIPFNFVQSGTDILFNDGR